jgi:purine-binding chemotaxis protein CheW
MDDAQRKRFGTTPSLLFRVRDRLCALPSNCVIEIMRPLPVAPLAGAPAAVLGLAVVRGEPVPVIELGTLFDGGSTVSTRLVSIVAGSRRISLAVDSVLGVREIDAASLRDLPALFADRGDNAVTSIGMLDAELLTVLNSARLMTDDLHSAPDTKGVSA